MRFAIQFCLPFLRCIDHRDSLYCIVCVLFEKIDIILSHYYYQVHSWCRNRLFVAKLPIHWTMKAKHHLLFPLKADWPPWCSRYFWINRCNFNQFEYNIWMKSAFSNFGVFCNCLSFHSCLSRLISGSISLDSMPDNEWNVKLIRNCIDKVNLRYFWIFPKKNPLVSSCFIDFFHLNFSFINIFMWQEVNRNDIRALLDRVERVDGIASQTLLYN